MISRLGRKLKSALGLLRGEDPWGQVYTRAGENLRGLRLSLTGDRRLFYRHQNGFRYVVLREAPETRTIYHRAQNYEKTESLVISRWLERGDFAVDCGANVGLMAALMAARTGPEGSIWAVEPSPSTSEKLAAVIAALPLKQVTMIRSAVSYRAGEVMFSDDASSSEANAIRLPGDSDGTARVRVPSVRLEELLASAAPRHPALIKMDIEGAEPLAFRGWPSLAATAHPPLFVFEVYPRGLARLGFAPSDIFSAMPLHRYRLWHLNASWPNSWPEYPRGVPFALKDPFAHPWPMHSNVVAVPNEGGFSNRAERLRDILPPHEPQG